MKRHPHFRAEVGHVMTGHKTISLYAVAGYRGSILDGLKDLAPEIASALDAAGLPYEEKNYGFLVSGRRSSPRRSGRRRRRSSR